MGRGLNMSVWDNQGILKDEKWKTCEEIPGALWHCREALVGDTGWSEGEC